MSSTEKGDDWYFAMNAHVGVDTDSGVTQRLDATTATVPDSQAWDELHGENTSVSADKG